MSDTKHSPDLSALDDDYAIIGELDDGGDARTYIATRKGEGVKRREDQTGVLITIVTTPAGDEANALTHLAADTQILARTTHRRLIPVIEGRWIGADAFAVVTQRTTDPSLAQRLVTGETFTNPRIAAILRELNGLLEWAREQKIVHRNIIAERIFLEPKTDRVRVSFAIAPIRRLHQSDADDEARTIARLAMAMLTGEQDPQAYEGKTLAELRPDLPDRLGEATAALLDEKTTGTPPDVAAYLALIGMADPVAAGETEAERMHAEILEEQRVEREKLATERADFERTTATERADLERAMAEEREKLKNERVELQNAVTREREELQRAVTQERAALVAKHAELERIVPEQRAELERAAALDRQQIEELRAEIQRAGEREMEMKRQTALDDIGDAEATFDQGGLATPAFLPPMFAPVEPLVFNDDSPLMRDDEIVFAPQRDDAISPETISEAVVLTSGAPSRRKRWILTGAVAGIVAIVAASAVVLGGRHTPAHPVAAPETKSTVAPAPVATAPVATVSSPVVPLPSPTSITDSSTVEAARLLDSTSRAARSRDSTSRVARSRDSTNRVARSRDSTKAAVSAVTSNPKQPVRDTTPRRTIMPVTDTLFIPGAAPVVKRDTVARPDTTAPPR